MFDDLIANPTLAGVKTTIKGYCSAAGLNLDNWLANGVGRQMLEVAARAVHGEAVKAAKAIRGFASLDTSVDPGDSDPYDPANVDLPAGSGFLSTLGEKFFGTTRGGQTFANGTVLFQNNGIFARTFAPDSLTWTWTNNSPPDPAPTYRNAPDPAIYTNPNGTVTIGAGKSRLIPVVAEEIGTGSNVNATGSLSLTTTMVGVTATNTTPILGTNREAADRYRVRCRRAPSRLSFCGPVDAYAYFANTNLDGTPLKNADDAEVGITRVWTSKESAVGALQCYFADDDGGASAADVTAANLNIATYTSVAFGTITYSGVAAVPVSIHVAGSAEIRAVKGIDDEDLKQAVKTAIVEALGVAFRGFDIGGYDQNADGAGFIYTVDFLGIAGNAYPGLYRIQITTPAPPDGFTALAAGRVATLNTAPSDWTITVVP